MYLVIIITRKLPVNTIVQKKKDFEFFFTLQFIYNYNVSLLNVFTHTDTQKIRAHVCRPWWPFQLHDPWMKSLCFRRSQVPLRQCGLKIKLLVYLCSEMVIKSRLWLQIRRGNGFLWRSHKNADARRGWENLKEYRKMGFSQRISYLFSLKVLYLVFFDNIFDPHK